MGPIIRRHLAGTVWLPVCLVVVGTLPAPALSQGDRAPGSYAECSISFEPSSLSSAEGSVLVRGYLSQEIGAVEEVVVEEGSDLGVVESHLVSPTIVRLSLLSDGAARGSWTVTVTGEEGVCTGRLSVMDGWGGSFH